MKKIRSSQAAIFCTELNEIQLFPVSIVNTITRDVSVFILKGKRSNYSFKNLRQGLSPRNFEPDKWCPKI